MSLGLCLIFLTPHLAVAPVQKLLDCFPPSVVTHVLLIFGFAVLTMLFASPTVFLPQAGVCSPLSFVFSRQVSRNSCWSLLIFPVQ